MAARPHNPIGTHPIRSAGNVSRIIFTIVVVLILIAVLARWVSRHNTIPPLEVLFPTGELIIAVDPSYPPFAAFGDDGLFGLDIDLGQEIGARIGLPVRFVSMGYDGLYDSLRIGQTDVIISALLMDGSRLGDVRYSRYYYDDGLVLVSPVGRPKAEMETMVGNRMAYAFGSAADAEARQWLRRIGSFETAPYELPRYALDAVRLQMADAALVDATTARQYLSEHPDWEAEYKYVTHSLFAVAVRRDRVFEWELIDEVIQQMRDDGTLDQIIDRWL